MATLTAEQVKLLDGMCPGAQKAGLGTALSALQAVVQMKAELPITTGGAVNTLTADRNVGIVAAKQAGAAAAAVAGGSIYVISFDQVYNRLVSAKLVATSKVPNINAIQVVGDAPNGGVACIVMAAAAAGDIVTLVVPGVGTVTLTALANGAPVIADSEWAVGAGGAINVDSALIFANLLNNAVDASSGGCTALVGGPISALAIGACVVIRSNVAGATIATNALARMIAVTDIIHIATTARTMRPGLVLQTALEVTATVPATGNTLKLAFDLQKV